MKPRADPPQPPLNGVGNSSGFNSEDDVRSFDKRGYGSAFDESQFLNCFHRDRCHEAHATGIKLHIRNRFSAVDTANAGRNLVACADLHATGV
jgi:hypothetical protein